MATPTPRLDALRAMREARYSRRPRPPSKEQVKQIADRAQARSSTAELSVHNRLVAGSTPAAPTKSPKLKVYGTTLDGRSRVIVAARSMREAARLWGVSVSSIRDYVSDTGNENEIAVAMSDPGQVFEAPRNGMRTDEFQKKLKAIGPTNPAAPTKPKKARSSTVRAPSFDDGNSSSNLDAPTNPTRKLAESAIATRFLGTDKEFKPMAKPVKKGGRKKSKLFIADVAKKDVVAGLPRATRGADLGPPKASKASFNKGVYQRIYVRYDRARRSGKTEKMEVELAELRRLFPDSKVVANAPAPRKAPKAKRGGARKGQGKGRKRAKR